MRNNLNTYFTKIEENKKQPQRHKETTFSIQSGAERKSDGDTTLVQNQHTGTKYLHRLMEYNRGPIKKSMKL